MLGRPVVNINGLNEGAAAGVRPLQQCQLVSETTNGNVSLSVAQVLAGVIARTGPNAAGFTDTLPSVDSILAAVPTLSKGDNFNLVVRNTSNQTGTIAAGTGMTLTGTATIATNKAREFMVTINNQKRTVTLSGTTTNASATLSGFTAAQLANVEPGMAVSGTGIGVSAKVIGVSPDAGTITVDVVSTATASNVGITFTPTADVQSLRLADV